MLQYEMAVCYPPTKAEGDPGPPPLTASETLLEFLRLSSCMKAC